MHQIAALFQPPGEISGLAPHRHKQPAQLLDHGTAETFRVLQHIEHEAAKLPAGANWLASSDIIESVFGHYKTFTARGPLKEVGRLVLLIPAFLSDLSAPVIREAMASVRTVDVKHWVDTHIGESMLARRRRTLRADTKTA